MHFRCLWPSWRVVGQTYLTHEQLGQRLSENILTGFSIYSPKPYYGTSGPNGFRVRRRHSRMKKASLSPTVHGIYGLRDGRMTVSIEVAPHPVWLAVYALYIAQSVFFWFISLMSMPQLGNFASLFRGLFMPTIVAVFLWLILKHICDKDLRYWKWALELRKIPA